MITLLKFTGKREEMEKLNKKDDYYPDKKSKIKNDSGTGKTFTYEYSKNKGVK